MNAGTWVVAREIFGEFFKRFSCYGPLARYTAGLSLACFTRARRGVFGLRLFHALPQ